MILYLEKKTKGTISVILNSRKKVLENVSGKGFTEVGGQLSFGKCIRISRADGGGTIIYIILCFSVSSVKVRDAALI